MPSPFITMLGLYDLYRNDECLSDIQTDTYTLKKELQRSASNPDSEYELFSDRITRIFPSLVLDDRLILQPGPQSQTVNYKWLKELLLSKELGRDKELEWVGKKNFRFLDGADLGNDHTAFISVPRSGNSFLRCFIEEITGVLTGSDLSINYQMQLQVNGLAGESNLSTRGQNVFITKTHWPGESPFGAERFRSKKAFCITRNPIDSTFSGIYLT
jgi:hypothetical protein